MSANLTYTEDPLATPQRRLHLRQPVTSLAYVDMGEANGGILLNISEWGLTLHAAEILSADRPLGMRFKLPESSIWIKASGRIVWRSESKKKAGVCFVDLSEDVREQIREWVYLRASEWEISAQDSQPKAAAREASHLLDSETAKAPGGLLAGAPQTATQAIGRGAFARLLARITRLFLGDRAPQRDRSAEPVSATACSFQDVIVDKTISYSPQSPAGPA